MTPAEFFTLEIGRASAHAKRWREEIDRRQARREVREVKIIPSRTFSHCSLPGTRKQRFYAVRQAR